MADLSKFSSLNQSEPKGSLLLKKPSLEEQVNGIFNTGSQKNIVEKGDSNKDVATKAAQNKDPNATDTTLTTTTDGATTGASTDITPATGTTGVSSGMEVKTKDGDKKKYQLGFSLYGYKSIIQKNDGPKNNMNGLGSKLHNSDIAWLASIYNLYENNGEGFNQNEIVKINKAKTDGAGLTIGAWSITQKHNFKGLAKYMRDYGLPEQYCQVVELGDGKQCDVNLPRNRYMVIRCFN